MNLTYDVENLDDWDRVTFRGVINEDAEVALANFSNAIGKNAIFNLRNIRSVNSLGVRAWINFIREVDKVHTIIFEECAPEVVSQINMIPNFKGKAKIRSVYASYSCEHCSNKELVLFEEGRNLPPAGNLSRHAFASVPCTECNEAMEMEELEDEFFGWLEAA